MCNPNMPDIIQALADYVINSGFEVDVNPMLPTVVISDGEDEIFFQEHAADDFITHAKKIQEESGLDYETCLLAAAKSLVECLV